MAGLGQFDSALVVELRDGTKGAVCRFTVGITRLLRSKREESVGRGIEYEWRWAVLVVIEMGVTGNPGAGLAMVVEDRVFILSVEQIGNCVYGDM